MRKCLGGGGHGGAVLSPLPPLPFPHPLGLHFTLTKMGLILVLVFVVVPQLQTLIPKGRDSEKQPQDELCSSCHRFCVIMVVSQ